MANLNINKFVSTTFGVATEVVAGTGVVLGELSNSSVNTAKVLTSVSGGVLQETEAFFGTRAIELQADTKLAKLKASIKLEAVEKIAKDEDAKTKVKDAMLSSLLEEFSDV